MTTQSVDTLAEAARVFAVKGAMEYLSRNNLKVVSPEALAECLHSWVKIKLPEALRDAKEALACNMGKVAEVTFASSMIQAGIEAAKEASIPPMPTEKAGAR